MIIKNYFLSAYADDFTVFITSQDDIRVLTQSIEIYGRVSSSRVN